MFEYQLSRYAEQHTEKLVKEADNARLARTATPRIAVKAARTLRNWANWLDKGAAGAAAARPSTARAYPNRAHP